MSLSDHSSTRRNFLMGAAGAALYATLPGVAAAAAQRSFVPDFADPVEALRAHVKLVGSLAKERVVSFYRLNIYADLNEGNFVPLFTLNNLLIDNWTPKGNDSFQMLKYEAGYYTAIDSYEVIKTFKHPLTGKSVPVQNFRLGPVPRGYDKDKYTVMGYNPNPLPLEVIGDRVFLATQSIESAPSFTDPGETRYTNSFMTYSATLADMQNDDLPSAPVHAQLQNKNEWAPGWKWAISRAARSCVVTAPRCRAWMACHPACLTSSANKRPRFSTSTTGKASCPRPHHPANYLGVLNGAGFIDP